MYKKDLWIISVCFSHLLWSMDQQQRKCTSRRSLKRKLERDFNPDEPDHKVLVLDSHQHLNAEIHSQVALLNSTLSRSASHRAAAKAALNALSHIATNGIVFIFSDATLTSHALFICFEFIYYEIRIWMQPAQLLIMLSIDYLTPFSYRGICRFYSGKWRCSCFGEASTGARWRCCQALWAWSGERMCLRPWPSCC